MRRLVWALPALLSTFVSAARADVGAVDIRVADDRGSFLLRVTVTAFESGTFVLPIGTVVSTGDASVQDLVIGDDVRFEVEEGGRREVLVPAYCIHEHRLGPLREMRLHPRGLAAPELRELLRNRASAEDAEPGDARSSYQRRVVQAAVWAHLRGERAPRPLDLRDMGDAEHDLPGSTRAVRKSTTRKRSSSNRS